MLISILINNYTYYYATTGDFGSNNSLNWANIFKFTIKNDFFFRRSIFQNAGSATSNGLHTAQCCYGPQATC
jgi:hypothetical protein